MNEVELVSAWSMLEPSARQRARIERRVFEWIEASETSITGEWLALIKVEPLWVVAFASVGAASLALLTPVGWMIALVFP